MELSKIQNELSKIQNELNEAISLIIYNDNKLFMNYKKYDCCLGDI